MVWMRLAALLGVAEHDFPHTGNGLAEMGTWLASFTAEACNMAVAIEVPHGPVVDLLLDRPDARCSSLCCIA
jgi:hypothetical protein